ncbi:hypothetical protein GCM10007368_12130 [Isoptericola cucumis]|uniref:Uncharacterized protein n=1 Tax=Isoptericola cucumis TaxID=1776856 RepID=A0ABQ2B2W9_9MICO|nr:hypothetical protein GCM10007368_12130 [Isoptericola cucumis]
MRIVNDLLSPRSARPAGRGPAVGPSSRLTVRIAFPCCRTRPSPGVVANSQAAGWYAGLRDTRVGQAALHRTPAGPRGRARCDRAPATGAFPSAKGGQRVEHVMAGALRA